MCRLHRIFGVLQIFHGSATFVCIWQESCLGRKLQKKETYCDLSFFSFVSLQYLEKLVLQFFHSLILTIHFDCDGGSFRKME